MAHLLLPLHLDAVLAKPLKAGFSLVDFKRKAVTSRAPTFALPRQGTGQAALGERILTSRPELSAQFPYGFFPESK